MPLTADNFVQANSGFTTSTGTSVNVTLPSGTTAGNTVVVIIVAGGAGLTAPAGFALAKEQGIHLAGFYKSEVGAGETSWTFTTGSAVFFNWYVAELSNIDPVEPVDTTAGSTSSVSNGGTASTGTTGSTAGLSTVAFAAFSTIEDVATETHSWAGYTNGFEEVLDLSPGAGGGMHLAVARAFKDTEIGTYETTATFTTTGPSETVDRIVFALRAADTPILASLTTLAGLEWGTHGGMGNTGANSLHGSTSAPSGTWGTNYLIQGSSARNGSYGLQVVQSGAAAGVRFGNLSTKQIAVGFNVRVVSATGIVRLATISNSIGSSIAEVVYDSTNSKIGVRCGASGTVSYESGTTATNTWRWIDLRVKTSTTTWRAEWRIETAADTYTEQTAAELSGQAAGTLFATFIAGYLAGQTVTADFDDIVVAPYWVAYPLGPHRVTLLKVDPAGTPSVSGTVTNFSVFTANGTLAAWNAANARDALDEVPPTVSASADGVVQTATAASDYMEFPMQTYTASATEVIAGVRMLASAWGGAGAGTGTLGIRGHDGTTETTLIPATTSYDAASPTAESSTAPLWQCATWPVNPWTQTQLDAAVLRVGFSTDATPDMGVSVIYLEVAIKPATTEALFGESGSLYVEVYRNPSTFGIVGLKATPTAELGATVNYEVDGTPASPLTVTAGGLAATRVVQAPYFQTINKIELIPG